MKLRPDHRFQRKQRGISLIECMVYLTVFAVLISGAMVSFFLMLDNSTALRYNANDINRALQAGERWRADVRGATGKIQSTSSANGLVVVIPHGKTAISYRFSDGTLWRQSMAAAPWVTALDRVKKSQMEATARNQVKAWTWELELAPHKARAKVPLTFSFEAVAPDKP